MTGTDQTPLTAEAVADAAFSDARWMRAGYDYREVDEFLDKVVDQLRLPPEQRTMTAAEVNAVAFSSTRGGGYVPADVDAFLDRLAAQLARDSRGAAG